MYTNIKMFKSSLKKYFTLKCKIYINNYKYKRGYLSKRGRKWRCSVDCKYKTSTLSSESRNIVKIRIGSSFETI